MPDSILSKMDEIRTLCREFQVAELELIGSAVTDEADPKTSDFDFLIEFDYANSEFRALRDYFGFKDALARLLGRDVDFVSLSAVTNPYLIKILNEQRLPLYAA
jgi:predicted nucleotidyltransferase